MLDISYTADTSNTPQEPSSTTCKTFFSPHPRQRRSHSKGYQEMLPLASVAAVTAPADVSMGAPCHAATRSAPVFRSGCTASQIFFFCT